MLLTRPRPEAERTADELRALGHSAVLAPMLEIETMPDAPLGPGPWSAVLMTSGNAARAIAGHPQRGALVSLRCFAVGAQTEAAARLAGFENVVSAEGDGGDLARLVAEQVSDHALPLLYLAGDDRARDMAAALSPLRLQTAVVYRARAAAEFPADIVAALRERTLDGVLHYSRRSTAIFVACARKNGVVAAAAGLTHFCLSSRAAEPLSQIGATRIAIAADPDAGAMLNLIGKA